MDVVRAAVAEVEDYERIEVRRLPRLAVDGPAVSDLTHLIAELLENATVFSPPHTAVQVLGERVANGYTLEIHDRGLGMASDLLLEANLRLAETPEFELSDTDRLGLFVVSRLAQRQQVRVSLQPSPYGGTTAVVFLPGTLLTETADGGREDDDQAPGGPVGNELEHAAGKLAALAQVPVPRPERERSPAVIDGPVELEAPLGPDGLGPDEEDGLFRKRERGRDAKGPAAPAGPSSAPRGIAPVPPVSEGEQHQQARDQAPGGPAPLPRRRRPPVLVSDHGRTVDDRDAPRKRGAERPGPEGSGSGHAADRPSSSAAPQDPAPDAPQPTEGPDTPAPTTSTGLPRRIRQASLAPQLKADAAEPPRRGGAAHRPRTTGTPRRYAPGWPRSSAAGSAAGATTPRTRPRPAHHRGARTRPRTPQARTPHTRTTVTPSPTTGTPRAAQHHQEPHREGTVHDRTEGSSFHRIDLGEGIRRAELAPGRTGRAGGLHP